MVEEGSTRNVNVSCNLAGTIVGRDGAVGIHLVAPGYDANPILLVAELVLFEIPGIEILGEFLSIVSYRCFGEIAVILRAKMHVGSNLRRQVARMSDGERIGSCEAAGHLVYPLNAAPRTSCQH
jgi:hypothetical protein